MTTSLRTALISEFFYHWLLEFRLEIHLNFILEPVDHYQHVRTVPIYQPIQQIPVNYQHLQTVAPLD
jgi:hypothetical protein